MEPPQTRSQLQPPGMGGKCSPRAGVPRTPPALDFNPLPQSHHPAATFPSKPHARATSPCAPCHPRSRRAEPQEAAWVHSHPVPRVPGRVTGWPLFRGGPQTQGSTALGSVSPALLRRRAGQGRACGGAWASRQLPDGRQTALPGPCWGTQPLWGLSSAPCRRHSPGASVGARAAC